MTSETKRTIKIDVDTFTVGDFIDFEEVAGMPLNDAMKAAAPKPVYDEAGKPVIDPETKEQKEEPGSMPMKVMLALLWVANRAEGTTLEDVRGWRITELDIEFVGAEQEDSGDVDPQPADG